MMEMGSKQQQQQRADTAREAHRRMSRIGTGFFEDLPADMPSKARRGLGAIRHEAWGQQIAPLALLVSCAAKAGASMRGVRVVDHPARDGPAPCNIYAAITGPSGCGKSQAAGVAMDMVVPAMPIDIEGEKPATGQGLMEAYMGTAGVDIGGKRTRVRKQVRHTALWYLDEVGELVASMRHTDIVRDAFIGDVLSTMAVTAAHTRRVEDYTCGILGTGTLEVLASLRGRTHPGMWPCWIVVPAVSQDMGEPPQGLSAPAHRIMLGGVREGLTLMPPPAERDERRARRDRELRAEATDQFPKHWHLRWYRIATALWYLLDPGFPGTASAGGLRAEIPQWAMDMGARVMEVHRETDRVLADPLLLESYAKK